MKFIILAFLLINSAFAKESLLDSVKRSNWGDLPVVWIEDDKFPRFTASVYFQDGALNDPFPGVTQAAFDQWSSGTSKESQREISDFFDFYGANIKNSVTHEYSVFTVQALIKDIGPVVGKVCELFSDAQYPQKELTSYASRGKSHLKNLVSNHANLADRIFRQISLQGTPYMAPVEGKLDGYDKLTSVLLKERLQSLNRAKKVIYISGPKGVSELEKVIKGCNWKSETSLKSVSLTKPSLQNAVYLIPVAGANQAQIRIGRYMTSDEVDGKHDQFNFLAGYLGGGFTSKLVQELRVKRGLTYSAGAYVSIQRDYGRAGIMTFSKNETAAEAISIIEDVLQQTTSAKFTPEEFKHQQGNQIGSHLFGFEATTALLGQIMLYDHQKRSLQQMVDFPENIARLKPEELAKSSLEAFPWAKQTIVVVGDKSLEKSLSRIRPVRILNAEDFL